MDVQQSLPFSFKECGSFQHLGFLADDLYYPPENITTQSDTNPINTTASPKKRKKRQRKPEEGDVKNTNSATTPKKVKKRQRRPEEWRRNIKQKCRNSGKEYEMWTKDKKNRPSRSVKDPCGEKCRLKCYSKFSEEDRLSIFSSYWSLADIDKQRQFILNSMDVNEPRYRYVKEGGSRKPRQNNMQYFVTIAEEPIQVCKLFFMNTLDINSRNIGTVLKKSNKLNKVLLEGDQRGKHGKHRKVKFEIRDGIKLFIESIPKIESSCLANSEKLYIDGYKTLADLYKVYVNRCQEQNVEYGKYALFYRIFNIELNISLFIPKRDQCELCDDYAIATEEQKTNLKKQYEEHILGKALSFDDTYNPPENILSESDEKNTNTTNTSPKKEKKRQPKPEECRRIIKQICRNSGKEYEMWTKDKKNRPSRSVKDPCGEKCRLKCYNKFNEEDRLSIFSSYWSLSNIEKQRQFILNSMVENKPRYRYAKEGGSRAPRQYNMQYYLTIDEDPIQVCKLFFMNTLDINSRNIITVLKKSNKLTTVPLEADQRGKHGKHPKVKPEIRDGIKSFIESITKIESFYPKANCTKLYIDGCKSIAQLHKHYVDRCREQNMEYGNYAMFFKMFNSKYKKDQSERYVAYANTEEQKTEFKKDSKENSI